MNRSEANYKEEELETLPVQANGFERPKAKVTYFMPEDGSSL